MDCFGTSCWIPKLATERTQKKKIGLNESKFFQRRRIGKKTQQKTCDVDEKKKKNGGRASRFTPGTEEAWLLRGEREKILGTEANLKAKKREPEDEYLCCGRIVNRLEGGAARYFEWKDNLLFFFSFWGFFCFFAHTHTQKKWLRGSADLRILSFCFFCSSVTFCVLVACRGLRTALVVETGRLWFD